MIKHPLGVTIPSRPNVWFFDETDFEITKISDREGYSVYATECKSNFAREKKYIFIITRQDAYEFGSIRNFADLDEWISIHLRTIKDGSVDKVQTSHTFSLLPVLRNVRCVRERILPHTVPMKSVYITHESPYDMFKYTLWHTTSDENEYQPSGTLASLIYTWDTVIE